MAALLLFGCFRTASGQVADSARVGVSTLRQTPAGDGQSDTRVDTAITTFERPSHVAKYLTIGAALGAASGVGFVAYALQQCNGHSTNGIPACLGMSTVAPLAVMAGALGGGLLGWGAGVVANARHP